MPFPFSSPPPRLPAEPASALVPNASITELKTRARIGLHALRAGDASIVARARAVSGQRCAMPLAWRLGHCLAFAAQGVGFRSWDQARQVLGGHADAGHDAGTFWHAPRCESLVNHWFANLAAARDGLATLPGHVLLPYRRQFVVVNSHYLEALGVPAEVSDWHEADRDLVAAYGTAPWRRLCAARTRAPLENWLPATT